MHRILLGLGACCTLAACGPAAAPPSSGPRDLPTQVISTSDGVQVTTSTEVRVISQEVNAPVDRVWAALPGVYEQLGLEAAADPARRTMSGATSFTRRFMGEPATRYFDCGQGSFGSPIASSYTIRMTVSTTVNPGEGSGSRLDTMVEAHARSADGANAVAAQCRTRGRLEQMIATMVVARAEG